MGTNIFRFKILLRVKDTNLKFSDEIAYESTTSFFFYYYNGIIRKLGVGVTFFFDSVQRCLSRLADVLQEHTVFFFSCISKHTIITTSQHKWSII